MPFVQRMVGQAQMQRDQANRRNQWNWDGDGDSVIVSVSVSVVPEERQGLRVVDKGVGERVNECVSE